MKSYKPGESETKGTLVRREQSYLSTEVCPKSPFREAS
jgi:hypothetical protein